MKLVRKSDDIVNFNKCRRWANQIDNNLMEILALPSYISKKANLLEPVEADEIVDLLKESQKRLNKLSSDVSKAISELE